MRSKYRLGIDAGGTFTDFILARKDGSTEIYKVLSTPTEPTKAIENGLKLIGEETGLDAEEIVSNSDLCINGTTVGLNALITHSGARTGLIATKGHEDSIEIRLGHKEDGYRYDPNYPPATMLAPRHLRKGVRERVISTGGVKTPLNEDDVREACEYFLSQGVESVAISFVWSVLYPNHENRAAEIVRELMPDVRLTVGSQLYPQVREYTRTSTAVVNAYLAPILQRYVEEIDGYFQKLGSKHPVRYFQSNGGLALGKVVSEQSVYAINSGPASAPQAALDVAKPWGEKNIITCDMGGTSFDITLTRDGHANVNKNIDFLRYRIGIPMIQVETLGAGGGSIGWIDDMGLMQMGPQSAGSEPGPACYGQGGDNPTTTDANLVLGYLNPDGLVGGRVPLDMRKAFNAIQSKIANPLGISVERAAYGMFTIVNNNMVNAIRRVSVERGYDPRDFVLMAAGGATGAHITALAREMGVSRVMINKLASGLCAYGQIISDVKYNYMAPAPLRLEGGETATQLDDIFVGLEDRGRRDLIGDGFADADIGVRRSLDMRYVGQVHECTVDIEAFEVTEGSLEKIKQAFHARHKELYTYDEPNSAIEVVNVESTITGFVDRPERAVIPAGKGAQSALKSTRKMVFDANGLAQETPVYDGELLGAGDCLSGPAVIEEVTTTIVVEPGWKVSLHETGTYVLTLASEGETASATQHDATGSSSITTSPSFAAAPASLEAKGVAVSFGGFRALNEVNLTVSPGSIHGLIGPNGAGKTTMVNVMTGFQELNSGRISLGDKYIDGLSAHHLRRIGIARTFQSGRLFSGLSVLDNLSVTGVGLGRSRHASEEEARRILNWMKIDDLANKSAAGLPYTDERRVGIARALMFDPAFLILDEPAAGMSETEADALAEIIRDISTELGVGVLLIEHNVALVLSTASHIYVLDAGTVIAEGNADAVINSERVRDAYLGTLSEAA